MQKQLSALGVQTVYTQTYPADTTNFQSIASQLSAKKPDLIAQGAVFEDGVGLVRSLKHSGRTSSNTMCSISLSLCLATLAATT